MSALLLFLSGNEAFVATDAAAAVGTRLVSLTPKIHVLPHLHVAMGVRGHFGALRHVIHLVQNLASPEDLQTVLPAKLKETYGFRVKWFPKLWGFDLGFAGYDKTGPYVELISSVSREDHPAFEFRRFEVIWVSPNVPMDLLRSSYDQADRDPDGAAIAIMDAQRSGGGAVIGGYGQITSVGRKNITTRLLKPYPDKILQPIDRFSGITVKSDEGILNFN
ncbi:hypothetical protein [Pararhizobium sp.]|uniref:hypothetical protein n=1 Tax=Pararhizobium sp. TaxID=1977563 RepID=UPI003D0D3D51